MKQIQIIKNKLLREHEKVMKPYIEKLYRVIKKDGYINNPIIVDKKTMVILDGHHRFNVLKLLGMSSSPVYLC